MRAIHHHSIYKRFYSLAFLGFFFGVIYGIFSLTLPLLAGEIFPNIALLGFIFALPELVGVLLDVPLGGFAARFGRRHTMFYSGIILAISALTFVLFRNPLLFILTLVLYELATQAYIIPADAELMAASPPRRSGRFNGVVEGLHNFGFSVGPILAGFLLVRSLDEPFWLAIIMSLSLALSSFHLLHPEQKSESAIAAMDHLWRRDRIFQASIREFFQLGRTGMFMAFLFFIFALRWGFIALLEPLYSDVLGLSLVMTGLIYAGFTLPFLIVSTFIGGYIDRRGAKGVTIAGLLLIALSTIAFGLTERASLLFILSLITGIGDALLLPAIMAVIDSLSSYHAKERISGVKVFAESSGYFIGPIAAGVMSGFLGFAGAFVVLGAFILVVTVAAVAVPFRVQASNATPL